MKAKPKELAAFHEHVQLCWKVLLGIFPAIASKAFPYHNVIEASLRLHFPVAISANT